MSGISFISCPTESIHLQGRFDTYPKRRGLTRVAEIDRAGMNVCFGQDSIVDPWYPLGNGNILRILDAGLHICHMLGYADLSLMVKAGVQWGLFGGAIENLGTERHHEAYVKKIIDLELLGCFAMTETGHGSDVQSLETTATYDPDTGPRR